MEIKCDTKEKRIAADLKNEFYLLLGLPARR